MCHQVTRAKDEVDNDEQTETDSQQGQRTQIEAK
jgi:hypothetical protein